MDKSLKIDVICNDGSPLGVVFADVYGENGRVGIGGAELALMTICDEWQKFGHQVRLYNNPTNPEGSSFKQYPIDSFSPQDNRDVLIIFRSPNARIKNARGLKIWWSCDQYTVGSFKEFSTQVDKIVTISPFHATHFETTYGIQNTVTIDLPIRLDDYSQKIDKIPNRLIFCSVPDRGLEILADCYDSIKEEIPDLSLVITSDYRLWGVDGARNERFVSKFLGKDGVKFLGALPRRDMVMEQLRAQVQAYPCTYDELFCYAVAECQIAGALPITTDLGALATTNMGIQISGNPNDRLWKSAFVDMIIQNLKSEDLPNIQSKVQEMAIERFSLNRILGAWENILHE